jgi:hypothetical protein
MKTKFCNYKSVKIYSVYLNMFLNKIFNTNFISLLVCATVPLIMFLLVRNAWAPTEKIAENKTYNKEFSNWHKSRNEIINRMGYKSFEDVVKSFNLFTSDHYDPDKREAEQRKSAWSTLYSYEAAFPSKHTEIQPSSKESEGIIIRPKPFEPKNKENLIGISPSQNSLTPPSSYDYAKAFFEWNKGNSLSGSLLIDLEVKEGKLFNYIKVNAFHEIDGEMKSISFSFNTTNRRFLKKIRMKIEEFINIESFSDIIVMGDSPLDYSCREFLEKNKTARILRIGSTNIHEIPFLEQNYNFVKEKFSEMTGSNSIVINCLPKSKVELENMDKNTANLDRWIKANEDLNSEIIKSQSDSQIGNARIFKEALSGEKNCIFVVVDTNENKLKFPDGSSISSEDIKSWDPIENIYREPPLVIFIGCNTANIKSQSPGTIVRELIKKKYICGAAGAVGIVIPDKVADTIKRMLRDKNYNKQKTMNELLESNLPISFEIISKFNKNYNKKEEQNEYDS